MRIFSFFAFFLPAILSVQFISAADCKLRVKLPPGMDMAGASLQADMLPVLYNDTAGWTIAGECGSRTEIRLSVPDYRIWKTNIVLSDTVIEPQPVRWQESVAEVVITGTRAGRDEPVTIQNIDRKELNMNNQGQDIPVLLEFTPSAVSTSDAGAGIGYTGIRIRGTDATRINVTINGVPVNDAESQAVFWVNLPDFAASAAQVQIQRGVGTSTNGPAAFGASLNITTLTPSRKPWLETGHFAGSFNTFRNFVNAGTGLIKNKFYLEGRFSRISSNGYIDRASSSLWSYYLTAGFIHKKTHLQFIHFSGKERTYQAWYGVPAELLNTDRTYNIAGTDWGKLDPPYSGETDNYGQKYFQMIWKQDLGRGWTWQSNAFLTLGKGYYEQYKVQASLPNHGIPFLVDSYGDTLLESDLIRKRWLDNWFSGLSWAAEKRHRRFTFSTGGMGAWYNGLHFGEAVWVKGFELPAPSRYYNGRSGKADVNLYARLLFEPVKGLSLYADLQYRMVHYKTSGTTNDLLPYDIRQSWNFFNPKAGISYRFKEAHRIYIGYAMANREPNRDDLVDAPPGSRPRYETLHNLESGYQFEHSRFPVSLNAYWMYYQNQLVLSGKLNDVGGPVKINVPESYRAGLELSGSALLRAMQPAIASASARAVVLRFDYGFTAALNRIRAFTETVTTYDENYVPVPDQLLEIRHRNTPISFSPAFNGFGSLTAFPLRGLEVNWIFKGVSRQYLDNTGNKERSIPAYWYSNIRLAYATQAGPLRELRFSFWINNVFNRMYSSNGYTFSERYMDGVEPTEVVSYRYFYPQAGIQFYGGISALF